MIYLELTEEKFWNEYWAKCKLPDTINPTYSFDRCLGTKLKVALANTKGTLLEIGCAPGRWLVYLSKEIGLLPSGIEYSSKGIEITKQNFEMLDVKYGEFWNGDFFSIAPEERFDVIMSLGFIEHFTDAEDVIKKHLAWVKPNGKLVLGIPNFNGVYYYLQKILDKSIIEKHNLEIMNLEYFKTISSKLKLEIEYLSYLGSFEPTLPMGKLDDNNIFRFFVKGLLFLSTKIRKFRLFDSFNNKYISSYILCIYRKGT